MFGRRRAPKPKKETGFFADVRELKGLLELKVSQGHGRRAMHEALKEQLRDGAVTSVNAQEAASLKKQGLEGLTDFVAAVPKGQHIRMSSEEFKRLMSGQPK